MSRPSSVVVYDGPSMIDLHPVVGILTGLKRNSKNTKTGAIPQLWIMRSDMHPWNAVRSGADYSICGNCVHRGQWDWEKGAYTRSCYVTPMAPASIYRAYKAGSYPHVELGEALDLIRGLTIRLGAYGDPAALPAEIISGLASAAEKHLGYTHQADLCEGLQSVLMASADTPDDAKRLRERGWRTFRVGLPGDPTDKRTEATCPASAEAGHKTTCGDCKLCGGTSVKAKSITIQAHGSYAVHLRRNLAQGAS